MLDIKGLSVGYKGVRAVQDVSLTVRRGEVVSLIGSNGAGKSTLLRTIAGLLRPWEGTILLDNEPIHVNDYRRKFPEAVVVHLATDHSGRAAEISQGVLSIPHFARPK